MDLPIVAGVEFRAVVDFPGYAVGDDGSVWSKRVGGTGSIRIGRTWKRKTINVTACGYCDVQLYRDNATAHFLVHRLVLCAFRGECPPGCEARHGDGNRRNNALANLTWGTPAENAQDRDGHGTTARGIGHGCAKLAERDVVAIRTMHATRKFTFTQLGEKFGVHRSSIADIVKRRNWTHIN